MMKAFKILCWSIFFVAVVLALVKIFGSYSSSSANTFVEWEKPVNVYFLDKEALETSSCEASAPLSRTIINAETLGLGAIEALIKGLSQAEEEMYFSAVSTSTRIQDFKIEDGVAYVDFSSEFNEGKAGSCNVVALRSQVENTLIDLPDIDAVVISVNGETEGILEP